MVGGVPFVAGVVVFVWMEYLTVKAWPNHADMTMWAKQNSQQAGAMPTSMARQPEGVVGLKGGNMEGKGGREEVREGSGEGGLSLHTCMVHGSMAIVSYPCSCWNFVPIACMPMH